jgi:NSS family neurotransmitter:Na+ symporter
MIFVVAGVQVICFGWVFGVDKGLEEAHKGAQMRIPGFFRFVIKYVAPAYLIVIFVGFLMQSLPDATAADGTVTPGWISKISQDSTIQVSLGVILATIALLMVCTGIGARRWRAAGLDLDGREGAPDDDTPSLGR